MEWLAVVSAIVAIGGLLYSSASTSAAIDAQEDENERQREYATQEWNRQFNEVNEYNDPVNVNARLASAGINPAVYWNGGKGSSLSTASPSLAPSSGSLSVPNLGMSDAVAGLVNSPEKVADTLKTLYEAKSQKTTNEFQRQQIQAKIDNIIADTNNKDIDTALKTFEQEMNQQYGRALKHNEVNLAFQNYKLAYAETSLKIKQGEKVDLEKLTEQSEKLLKDSARYLNDTQRQLMSVDLRYRAQMLQSQINQNNASAALSSAQAQSENEWRATRGALLGLDYAIRNNEAEISDRTTEIRVLDALEHFKKDKYVTQQALEDYLYKKYTNDTRGVKDVMNVFYNFIPFGGSFNTSSN